MPLTKFLKIFIELATVLLSFSVLDFGPRGYGILGPQTGIEYTPPALEGQILTTGPPGKSQGPHSFDVGGNNNGFCFPFTFQISLDKAVNRGVWLKLLLGFFLL